MAFNRSANWFISFSFRDNNNNVATTGVHVPGSLTLADVIANASALADAMQGLSDALLVEWAVTLSYLNDSTATPPNTSEVERKLNLTFDAGDFKNAFRMSIPSPNFGMEQPRTDAADPAYPALVTFVDAMLTGPLGAGNGPRTYFGGDLTALSKAVISHRSRKPRI